MTRLDLPDLAKARKHLADAEDAFDHGDHDEAAALAAIGTGYAQLAAAEVITAQPEPIGIRAAAGAAPEVVAAWIRAAQGIDEARPHDGDQSCAGTSPEPAGPCVCCTSGYLPVFHGARCVSGLDPDGCGHSHAEHEAARRD